MANLLSNAQLQKSIGKDLEKTRHHDMGLVEVAGYYADMIIKYCEPKDLVAIEMD